MIASRSPSFIEPQRAISSSVRPQPEQNPVAGSIEHTLMQGVAIMKANGEQRIDRSLFAIRYSLFAAIVTFRSAAC
jgi:hypothetical protein